MAQTPRLAIICTATIFATMAMHIASAAAPPPSTIKVDGPPETTDIQLNLTPRIRSNLDWLKQRSYHLDLTAYAGLPPHILEQDLAYFRTAVEITGGKNRARRDAYILLNQYQPAPAQPLASHPGAFRSGSKYPFDVWVEQAGTEPIPIQLLPDPAVVKAHFLTSDDGVPKPVQELIHAGAPYGRTIIFVPGPDSQNPGYPRAPAQPHYIPSLKIGKIMGHDNDLDPVLNKLRAGEPGGAEINATITTVGLSNALYLVRIEQKHHSDEKIAYPIASGFSGLRRDWAARQGRDGPFANRIIARHFESFNGHTSAIVPRPLATTKSYRHWVWLLQDVVVYETQAANSPPVAVLSKDQTWEPYLEDYILTTTLGYLGGTPNVRRIAVFMNITPEDLLQVIARLHILETESPTPDPAAIQRLRRSRDAQAAN